MTKRYRKRYILLEIISNSKFKEEIIEKTIKKAIKELFGTFGLSEAHPKLLKEIKKEGKYVLQINHKYVQKAKFAMATIKKIKEKPIIFNTKKVYGTLKKIKKEVI